MHALDEMRGTHLRDAEIGLRLTAVPGYAQRFAATAGDITECPRGRRAHATLDTDASFDRNALAAATQRGLATLRQHGCTGWQTGPMFSDFQLHLLGVPDGLVLPHDPGDGQNRFRTASWRNLSLTAPYRHAASSPRWTRCSPAPHESIAGSTHALANRRPLNAAEQRRKPRRHCADQRAQRPARGRRDPRSPAKERAWKVFLRG